MYNEIIIKFLSEYMDSILLVLGILYILVIHFRLEKEQKRNRVTQAFMAGIIRSISDYNSKTDLVSPKEIPERKNKNLIEYKEIIENIQYEFSKDFWIEPYDQWLKTDRNLFDDSKYGNDGFNFIYLDMFDKAKFDYKSNK